MKGLITDTNTRLQPEDSSEDIHVSQVVEQVVEVPKISSQDRILQCTEDQILDVPEPEMVKQRTVE